MSSSWQPAVLVLSLVLNCCLICLHQSAPYSGSSADTLGRRLALRKEKPIAAPEGDVGDCSSVACPKRFSATPPVLLGASVYRPFQPDTRFRLRAPNSMLELTRMLYGPKALLGEPYLNYANPYQKRLNVRYQVRHASCRLATCCAVARARAQTTARIHMCTCIYCARAL